MRNQEINIIINSSNICIHNGHECANNGKSECLNCSVLTGSSKCSIKFTPASTSTVPNTLDQNKIIIKLPRPEEVTLPNPDDEDTAHFVHHSAVAIHHFHTYNMRTHIHYLIDDRWMGSRCHICGIPVIGKNFCESCNSIFESALENPDNSNSLAWFSSFKLKPLRAS